MKDYWFVSLFLMPTRNCIIMLKNNKAYILPNFSERIILEVIDSK